MKKKLLYAFLVALPFLILAGYLFVYLGAFKDVLVQVESKGPYTMIYKDHFGPYHKIVPVIEEVEAWVKSQGMDCSQSFGEYLDDPKTVEDARLRSHGGCIVDHAPEILPKDFKVQTLEAKKYLTAVFEGSPGIGPMKVYPKVYDFAGEHKLTLEKTVIEVYVIHSQKEMTTTYLFPLQGAAH